MFHFQLLKIEPLIGAAICCQRLRTPMSVTGHGLLYFLRFSTCGLQLKTSHLQWVALRFWLGVQSSGHTNDLTSLGLITHVCKMDELILPMSQAQEGYNQAMASASARPDTQLTGPSATRTSAMPVCPLPTGPSAGWLLPWSQQ